MSLNWQKCQKSPMLSNKDKVMSFLKESPYLPKQVNAEIFLKFTYFQKILL